MVQSLGEAVVEVGADTTGFQSEVQKGVESATKSASASLKSLGGNLSSVGKDLSLKVTAPLVGIAAAAINVQSQFEQSMNVLQVNAQASGAEMERLSDLAKQLGADTVFSAGEAADAMLELAKGGFKVAQIEGGGVQATMALAATEGLELADAATITSNAMQTFGINAKNASVVADTLAAGSAASSASVSSLAQALSQVGPGATNAGLSLQETVAVLSAFDAAGIKGSDAGTSLKTMLARLVPQTKKAKDAMKALGLDFTNADGSIKDITEVAGILQKQLGGLSQEERITALSTIFGSDATRAATVLMKEGTAGLGDYLKATKERGVAEDLANARMAGTAGAIERMKGALETAALTLGEALAPAVIVVADAIGGMAEQFSNLPDGVQTAIVVIGGVAAALGPILVIVGTLISSIGTIAGAFAAMGAAVSIAAGPLLLIVGIIAAVVAAVIHLWNTNEEFRAAVLETWAAIKDFIAQITTEIMAFWAKWGDDILRVASRVWNTFSAIVGHVLQAVMGLIRGALDVILGLVDVFAGILSGDWSRVWEGLKQILSGAVKGILSVVGNLLAAIGDLFAGLGPLIWDGVKAAVVGIGTWLYDAGRDLILGLINGIKAMVGAAADAVGDVVGGAIDAGKGLLGIGSPSKVFRQFGEWTGEGFALGMKDAARMVAKSASMSLPVPTRVAGHLSLPDRSVRPVVNVTAPAAAAVPSPGSVTFEQNYYGPSTSADRRRELEWLARFGTGRTPTSGETAVAV